jgi:hypothetical protein
MNQKLSPAVAKVLKRLHYPLDVMLLGVRWYVAYPLSLRHLEQLVASFSRLSNLSESRVRIGFLIGEARSDRVQICGRGE